MENCQHERIHTERLLSSEEKAKSPIGTIGRFCIESICADCGKYIKTITVWRDTELYPPECGQPHGVS